MVRRAGRGKVKSESDGRLKKNRPPSKADLVEKSRWQKLIDGEITVDDLDLEELTRCQVKNRAGGFSGRPPKNVPTELLKSFRVEFQKRVQGKFEQYTETALDALVDVAQNKRQAGVARVTAANSILERSLGKVTDKVQQEVIVKNWEKDFEGLFVDVPDPDGKQQEE